MARLGKLGWLLGIIMGTVFGVLYAPRKGKELRAKIKEEHKKGKLGIAPLQDDLGKLGGELLAMAKDIYESGTVQDVVERGRKELKKLSKDLVGEVHDFHYSKIRPLQHEIKSKVHFVKGKIGEGKRAAAQAKRELKGLTRKAKASAKIGKRAVREIKRTMGK